MFQTKLTNIPVYKFRIFEKFPELVALSTCRIGGKSKGDFAELNLGLHVGDEVNAVINNRRAVAAELGIDQNDLTCPEQVHGANIHVVTKKDVGRGFKSWEDGIRGTDALITNIPGVPIAVLTADCAPVFLFDPKNHAVGILHAGRKGLEGEIVVKTIQKMCDTFGTCAEKLLVGVGPCIYPCCYPTDLPETIREQLLSTGVKRSNIEESKICTCCNNDIFYSYRGDNHQTGRIMNLIMIGEKDDR